MRSSHFNAGLFLSLTLALFIWVAQPNCANAQSEPPTGTNEISQESIEKLLSDLEDPQKLDSLKQDLRTLLEARSQGQPKEPEVKKGGLLGQILSVMSDHLQAANQALAEAGRNMLLIPSLLQDLAVQAKDVNVLKSWGEMTSKVVLSILAGILAQALATRLMARARRKLKDRETYNQGYRILLLVGNTLLDLIPIVAFAAAAYGVLPLLAPQPGTQLAALALINSNVLVRLVLAVARLFLAPESPSLRFISLNDETVHYAYIWIKRIVRLGIYGYFVLEAALLLGLPDVLYQFSMKILGLVITLMAIILILQNRKEVAVWLRGDHLKSDPHEDRQKPDLHPVAEKIQSVGTLRNKLADFWYIIAIMLILGLFGTWILEVEGGLYYVARAIILSLVVLGVTCFLVRMSRRGIDHLFKISKELKKDYPELEARANRYLPLLKYSVKGLLHLVAFFAILQAWGLDTFSWLFSAEGGSFFSSLFTIILILAGAFLFWEIVSVKIERYLAKEREGTTGGKSNARLLTLLPLLKNVIRIVLVLLAGMSVLAHLGLNIAPLLAGAGVIGLAVGFGAQTLVKDVISGAFILIEDSLSVGDWVEAAGHSGTVESLTIRTLTLRDLSGTVHVVPFGEVTTILNYNRDYGYALIDAGVAYREDYGAVIEALQDVAADLRQDATWGVDIIGDLEIFGLNKLADSAVEIRVRLKTLPSRQFSIRRAFLERMKRIFDERGIEIPFPHHTIWFGVDKDGSAPPMRVVCESKTAAADLSDQTLETAARPDQPRPEIQYTSETQASEDVVEEKEQKEAEKEDEKKDNPG